MEFDEGEVAPTHHVEHPIDPDSVWFYLDSDANQIGPINKKQIQTLVLASILNRQSFGW